MPEAMTFLPKTEVLSLEEIDRLATAFIRRGTRKLRLTGGEPLVRRGIIDLVRRLGRHLDSGALEELTLTSNGSQLARHAVDLRDAGVRRINVSLDTLDPRQVRRDHPLGPAAAGARRHRRGQGRRAAHQAQHGGAGRGQRRRNRRRCWPLPPRDGHDLTLIETMPLGEIGADRVDHYLPLSQVRADLARRFTLHDLPDRTGGPARYVRIGETGQRLGFITPLTHNFCESCNRVRLTATGQLYLCLGQDDVADLRSGRARHRR